MKLAAHISNLLYDHECVVLPDFGGILATPKSAEWNKFQHRIRPPHKALSFNKNLNKNDGLLIRSFAEAEGLTYDLAAAQVSAFVNELKLQLQSVGYFEILLIGLFEQKPDGTLSFYPDPEVNYLKSAYGLKNLSLPQPVRKVAEPQAVVSKDAARPVPSRVTSHRGNQVKRLLYLPMLLSLIPILAYLFWIPANTALFKDGHFMWSDLNPFTTKLCPEYSAITYQSIQISPLSETDNALFNSQLTGESWANIYLFDRDERFFDEDKFLMTAITAKEHSIETLPEKETISEKPEEDEVVYVADQQEATYHIITGCFKEVSNANAFVNNLKRQGYNAYILDVNSGLYRVSVGGFENRERALDTLPKLRETVNKDAWLVKQKRKN